MKERKPVRRKLAISKYFVVLDEMVFALTYKLAEREVKLVGPRRFEGEMQEVMKLFSSEWSTEKSNRKSQVTLIGVNNPISFKKSIDHLSTRVELRPVDTFRRFKS